MFQHLGSLYSGFILAAYCFVKVKGDSLQEWFQPAESAVGETALMLTAISSRYCSAR